MQVSLYIKTAIILLLLIPLLSEKKYVKAYYESGGLKKEGWIKEGIKEGYWIYYYKEGNIQKKGHYHKNHKTGYWYFYSVDKKLLKEGHYAEGIKQGWWIFYENNTEIKVPFKNGKKDGYALEYSHHKLQKVVKYIENQKKGEWTTLKSFKNDNPQVQF